MNLIRRGASRYASWTRRQGSALNCGAPAGAAGVVLLVVTLLTIAYWAVIWPVLVIVFWVLVSCAGAALLGALAGGVMAHRRRAPVPVPRPAPVCGDCRSAPATAEVTYANGRRSDTAYTCDACWIAEEHRAAVPPEFRQVSTLAVSRLPAYAEIPVPAPPARQPAPAPPGLPDADAEVPVSPDNRAASDPGAAADLAAVLARTGQWTRKHP